VTRARGLLGRAGPVAVAGLLAGLVAGCSSQGIYGVTLPGGAASGDDAYRVTLEFRDVLDLVPQSAVKVNDVSVGSVESITLRGFTARVRVRLKPSVKLPDNATGEIRQSSLLGEKFVSLAAPVTAAPVGRLSDGDVIPLARTGRNIEVEEVLSALSLLLSGGGLEQIRTINRELNAALSGRENQLRSTLGQLETFVRELDRQKADIVRALQNLDRLAATLAKQKKVIANALDKLGPGVKVLAQQRGQLTAALVALKNLGTVGTRVIAKSRENTLADLRALQPILEQLVRAGTALPNALELLLTYPFPRNAPGAIKDDFVNLYATADLDLTNILGNLTAQPPLPGGPTPGLPVNPPGGLPLPSLPQLPGVTPGAQPNAGQDGDDDGSGDLLGLLTGGLR
jgi:phospholipid/cholesterol/gamma-HCH transport system substrate-binding protein